MFDLTLTFDNGPEPGVTPRVLDILRERDIKTTFFVIGEKLGDPERRGLAARAHGEGHWIGNHTFTHSVPLGQQRDAETAPNEIGRTQTAIGDLAHPNLWFRPFGGGGNVSAVAAGLAEAGATTRIVVGQAAERATTWASAIASASF